MMRQPDPPPDRTLGAAVVVSVLVHVLVLGAFCFMPQPSGPATHPKGPSQDGQTVEIQLISAAQAGLTSRTDTATAATPAIADGQDKAQPSDAPPGALVPGGAPQMLAAAAPAGVVGVNSSPSTGTAGKPADPATGDDYRRKLLDHITGYRSQPTVAAGARANGTVLVRFSVTRGGGVMGVSVFTSSGSEDLDDEAIATIWRARPMPDIPPTLPDRVSVTLPVSFSLGRAQAPG